MKTFLLNEWRRRGIATLAEWLICTGLGLILGFLLKSQPMWLPAACFSVADALLLVRRVAGRWRKVCEENEEHAPDV